jgi:hypothetical protein
MPLTPHVEKHFTSGDIVRDIVIGMADGLTVPFALAAGLTGAIAQSRLIITAGFAEIAAGSIAMGLGGYLAARVTRSTTRTSKRASGMKSPAFRKPKRRRLPTFSRLTDSRRARARPSFSLCGSAQRTGLLS